MDPAQAGALCFLAFITGLIIASLTVDNDNALEHWAVERGWVMPNSKIACLRAEIKNQETRIKRLRDDLNAERARRLDEVTAHTHESIAQEGIIADQHRHSYKLSEENDALREENRRLCLGRRPKLPSSWTNEDVYQLREKRRIMGERDVLRAQLVNALAAHDGLLINLAALLPAHYRLPSPSSSASVASAAETTPDTSVERVEAVKA